MHMYSNKQNLCFYMYLHTLYYCTSNIHVHDVYTCNYVYHKH